MKGTNESKAAWLIFHDVETVNAIASAVTSALEKTFNAINRETAFFQHRKKHPEIMHYHFLRLKFVYSLMEQRINEIKKGGKAKADGRLLLAIDYLDPDFFTDTLWQTEIWKESFKNFCLKEGLPEEKIFEQFEIFSQDWSELNDDFLATFSD